MADSNATKVAIVEDQFRIREGLRVLIDGTSGYQCTGAFGSVEEALPAIASQAPDVVLLDIGLPGMSGIDGIPLLKKSSQDLSVVMLTVYDDDKRILDALCAGACGYLLKETPPARLLESLREALDGGAPMSPAVARRVITMFRDGRPAEYAGGSLTPHEVRLLKLLAEGHNYETAGVQLGVTINTVRFHMRSIYEKMQVHSKSEAVAKAIRSRIIR
jgi:DNA-binding NarL/FixJ family response regulator